MNQEEELENISKEILRLKRKKRKVFLLDKPLFFYSKAGVSILTVVISSAFSSFGLLSAFYIANRDKIILWIVVGILIFIVLFLSYNFLYRKFTEKRDLQIDRQIEALKIKYREIKGSS
jgi:phosphotransferase system  glucose/maltose/N-acetylglucosamine-specific IIC component